MLKAGGHGKTSIERQMRRIQHVDGKRFKRQIEFILEADQLKKVDRRTTLLDVSRQENSAEHSWQTARVFELLVPDPRQRFLLPAGGRDSKWNGRFRPLDHPVDDAA